MLGWEAWPRWWSGSRCAGRSRCPRVDGEFGPEIRPILYALNDEQKKRFCIRSYERIKTLLHADRTGRRG